MYLLSAATIHSRINPAKLLNHDRTGTCFLVPQHFSSRNASKTRNLSFYAPGKKTSHHLSQKSIRPYRLTAADLLGLLQDSGRDPLEVRLHERQHISRPYKIPTPKPGRIRAEIPLNRGERGKPKLAELGAPRGAADARDFTGAGESDGGASGGLGVDDEELERVVGREGSEEAVESPLQRVRAVLAVVHPDHHRRLLRHRRWSSGRIRALDRFAPVERTQHREREREREWRIVFSRMIGGRGESRRRGGRCDAASALSFEAFVAGESEPSIGCVLYPLVCPHADAWGIAGLSCLSTCGYVRCLASDHD